MPANKVLLDRLLKKSFSQANNSKAKKENRNNQNKSNSKSSPARKSQQRQINLFRGMFAEADNTKSTRSANNDLKTENAQLKKRVTRLEQRLNQHAKVLFSVETKVVLLDTWCVIFGPGNKNHEIYLSKTNVLMGKMLFSKTILNINVRKPEFSKYN